MIRHASRLVALHDRLAPASLLNYQRDYAEWVRRVRSRRASDPVRKMIRTIVLQLGVNVALIAACFIAALFVHQRGPGWLRTLPAWSGGPKVVLCLGALLLSLPVVVAFLRKLQALSMILSELAIPGHTSERQKVALRTLLSNTILFAGAVAMSLFVLALSAPLLPTWDIFILLCVLAAALAILLRAHIVRLYARAQSVVRDTLSRQHEPIEHPREQALPPLLHEAELRTIVLAKAAPVLGRSIGDLQLRTRTGATIVAIRRDETTVHSPGPQFIFAAGDEILLVGDADQLHAGEKLLHGS